MAPMGQKLTIFLHINFIFLMLYLLFFHRRKEIANPGLLFGNSVTPNAVKEDLSNQRWIVVTTGNFPTEQIKSMNNIPGWQLLVVGNMNTPANWSCPGAIFLSIDQQKALGYNILDYIPPDSYSRKAIGYLYAIQHGAKYIYDTDDDNPLNDRNVFKETFVLANKMGGLLKQKDAEIIVANPYAHFGKPKIWPRGYPLEEVGRRQSHKYTSCNMQTPSIQQAVVNGDPDVDAIFRLTRKKIMTPLNIQFDKYAPSVVYPAGLFSPFNSQNTVFRYSSFWALLLPVSVTFRVTDIWRGYWAQPLLWKTGAEGNLAFLPTKVTQLRKSHLYLRDFGEEDKIYKQAGNLTKFLSNWNCINSTSFYDCMLTLSTEMAEKGFWDPIEVDLAKAWITDLKTVGYTEPKLSRNANPTPCLPSEWKRMAIFHPVEYDSEGEILIENDSKDKGRSHLRKYCNYTVQADTPSLFKTTEMKPKQPTEYASTLLVVTFNFIKYCENIWLLDLLYRPHFPNIVYCANVDTDPKIRKVTEHENFIKSGVKDFTFLYGNVTGGYTAYECLLVAMEMGYKGIEGYIMLSDDMILNFWNNNKFNKNEVWMMNGSRIHSTGSDKIGNWVWWGSRFGVVNLRKTFEEIYKEKNNQAVISWRKDREKFGYNSTTGMSLSYACDVLYIPTTKAKAFYEVGKVFRKNEIFLEIAVPTIVSGLSPLSKIVILSGKGLNEGERHHKEGIGKFYNESISVLHPIKFSKFNDTTRSVYCNMYVRRVLES